MHFIGVDVGPLPTAVIRRALRLELMEGAVHFSRRAQAHAWERHPDDFALCLNAMREVVASPDYVGRGPHQKDGFELIGEVACGGALVLVAVKLRPDASGRYAVSSTYVIDRNKLARRLRKGFASRV